jgi:NodT family efflux transporter outer membrane factor (OMF) lipoprotein
MSHSTRPLSVIAMAAAGLAACTTVGPDFRAPAAPTAAGYAMTGDAAPAGLALSPDAPVSREWWSVFGSPKLSAVMGEALAGSPSLAEAEATLARSQAQLAAERGAALPQAQANTGGQRERFNAAAFGLRDFPSPTLNLFTVGAGVTYDLDLFGGRRRAVEAAAAQSEAEARRGDAAYLTLTGNVALQAMRIAALNAQLEAVQAVIADDQRLIEIVRRADEAGGAASTQVLTVEAQLAEDEALAPPLRRELDAARHQLALLVGRSPGEWTAPDFALSDFAAPQTAPLVVPSRLVRQRPDILAAEADLHAATARIGVATAAQYPEIRLTADLIQTATDPAELFRYSASGWTLGAGVTAPLLNGGTLKARRQAAEADARVSLARYQTVVLRAFVQVSDALSALGHDEQSLAALERAQAAAQASAQNASRSYELGSAARVAVIDAQRQLSRSRRALALAQGQRFTDLVSLYTAMGVPPEGTR